MGEIVEELENEKQELLRQLCNVGYMRPGSISENYRKCGKHPCVCEQPEHPGHGPRYLYTKTEKGKTVSKQLKPGAMLEKYKREIENRKEFRQLCKKLMEVNERLCELGPVDADEEEKTAECKKNRR